MVLHVNELATKANIGKVIVATPERRKIAELVKGYGGNAVKTGEKFMKLEQTEFMKFSRKF